MEINGRKNPCIKTTRTLMVVVYFMVKMNLSALYVNNIISILLWRAIPMSNNQSSQHF